MATQLSTQMPSPQINFSSTLQHDYITSTNTQPDSSQAGCLIQRETDARIGETFILASSSACSEESRETKRENTRIDMGSTKWVILTLLCASMGLNHFCVDAPASLISQFDDWMHEDSVSFQMHFNMLFTVYSFPNIFIPLFGGSLVSRYGDWQMLIVFAICMMVGEFIFAMGVHAKSWAIMFLGRFVYGLGGENLYTSKSLLITRWFPDNQLALAFGIGLSLARLGTVFGDSVSPKVANSSDLPTATYIGFVATVTILFASLCIARIEITTEKRLSLLTRPTNALQEALLDNHRRDEDAISQTSSKRSILSHRTTSVGSEVDIILQHASADNSLPPVGGVIHLNMLFWILGGTVLFVYGCVVPYNIAASGILLERNFFRGPPAECQLIMSDQCTSGGLVEPNTGNPSSDIFTGEPCPGSNYAAVLPSSLNVTRENTHWDPEWESNEYVYESLTSSDVNCGDSFWANACTRDYCDGKDDASEKAGVMMSIPYLIGAISSPFIGALSDKYGYRLLLTACSCSALAITHLILAFDDGSPLIPLVLQGIGFSIYAAVMWPMVALITETQYLGLAYGILVSFINISLTFFPMIVAALYNISNSYLPDVELFFVACATCGLALTICISFMDCKSGGRLNQPAASTNIDAFDGDASEGICYLWSDEDNIMQEQI